MAMTSNLLLEYHVNIEANVVPTYHILTGSNQYEKEEIRSICVFHHSVIWIHKFNSSHMLYAAVPLIFPCQPIYQEMKNYPTKLKRKTKKKTNTI